MTYAFSGTAVVLSSVNMKVFLVLCVGVVFASAELETAPQFQSGNLKVLYRVFEKCGKVVDMGSCLKLKAVSLIDKALTVDALPISEYVSIAKDPAAQIKPTEEKTEAEIENSLPQDHLKKSAALDEILQDRVSRFLETRTIQFNLPTDVLEGRRKKDKGGMMMMAALAIGGMMVQMAMSKIALIAGKALLVGKIALLLSAVIGLKKLVGGGGGDSHPQVVYASGGDHGGWGKRSFAEEQEAQKLAYRGHQNTQR